ncbi:hypothetical protein AQJ91_15760 [Streptomyces dysideae]|uniref:Uncharacterized protein n=1 Tax=Streptomyces dysideae TaxID=909626 RepID=A0A101V0F8_9ACTN|nr:hypothetical protein AQJ91_15760 [Streptomyces dysideae]
MGAPVGSVMTVVEAVGEFGPVIAVALVPGGRSPGRSTAALLAVFVLPRRRRTGTRRRYTVSVPPVRMISADGRRG